MANVETWEGDPMTTCRAAYAAHWEHFDATLKTNCSHHRSYVSRLIDGGSTAWYSISQLYRSLVTRSQAPTVLLHVTLDDPSPNEKQPSSFHKGEHAHRH